MSRTTVILSAAFLAALSWIVPAGAQAAAIGVGTQIGLDFSSFNGGGTNYNLFPGNGAIGAGSVTDTSGVVVDGVSLTLAGGTFFNGNAGSTAPSFPTAVRNDFTGSSPNPFTLTIGGLDPSFVYVWVSSSSHSGGTAGNRDDRVTLTGIVDGAQTLAVTRQANSEHLFTGIQPTAAGVITATMTEDLANNPILNGVLLTAVAPPAPIGVGTVIGVDFSAVNGGGTNYNLFATNGAIGAGSVIDTSGAVVEGVSLTLAGGAFFNGNAGSTAPSFPGEVRNDFTGSSPNPFTFTISGLDPNFLYDWVSSSSHSGSTAGNRDDRITLTGLVGGPQTLAVTRQAYSEHLFTGIQPTAAGMITATMTEDLANNPILNGLRLEATGRVADDIPEPATIAMLSLAFAGLGGYVRRRRRL